MKRRPPRLIWGFLGGDLLRLGLMTAAGLVLVIAFALSVRFLAEGRIDLGGALWVMALALVPMLEYALPFAGGMAATLTYHRFASDNEATAAMASGVSHRSLMAPAGGLGFVVGVAVLLLSHEVIPHFLRAMEEVATRDLAGMVARAIERGESVKLGRLEVLARSIVRAGPDPAVGAIDRLRLEGVLAARVGARGTVESTITADEVNVWLFEDDSGDEPGTVAQLVFKGARGHEGADAIQGGEFASQRVRIPSTFTDDPKYLTFGQLRELRTHPERLNKIDALRRALALRLAEQQMLDDVRASLAATGSVVLERPGGERMVVYATGLRFDPGPGRWRFLPAAAGQAVRLDRVLAGGSTFRQQAGALWIEPDSDDPGEAAWPRRGSARVRGEDVVSIDREAAAPGTPGQGAMAVGRLRSLGNTEEPAEPEGVAQILERAELALMRADLDLAERIESAADLLADKVDRTQREVTSKQHERAAYAAASLLTILCGAVTALRRQSGLPLPVYLWCFFPALTSVITISAGQTLTHRAGPAGLTLLWGGVAGLAAFVIAEYVRLRKH